MRRQFNVLGELSCTDLHLQDKEYWWRRGGSNSRPSHCERDALPAELRPHGERAVYAGAQRRSSRRARLQYTRRMRTDDPDVHPPYTTEYCDREYNARAAVPEHPRILASWAERGAATRRQRAGLLDLPYGESAAERLDVFPTPRNGSPLLVYIHGGYWRALDKSDFSWVAPPFVDHGVAVAVVNYGLAPGTSIEEIVRQMLRAFAWLYRKADDLGFDPQRIYVAGHSAGGHLSAMMLAA